MKMLAKKVMRRINRKLYKLRTFNVKKMTTKNEDLLEEGFFSQYGQDKFVDSYFNSMKGGFFVDVGANDGVTLSNTYYLEKELNWSGIAIEPLPIAFEKLEENRNSILIKGCIAEANGQTRFLEIVGEMHMWSGIVDKYDDTHLRKIDAVLDECDGGQKTIITVPTYTLDHILEKHKIRRINYLTIDTEGGELEILQSVNYRKYDIDLIGCENNYKSLEIDSYLRKQGYRMVAKIGCDEMYAKTGSHQFAADTTSVAKTTA